jgi:hypothetical protein
VENQGNAHGQRPVLSRAAVVGAFLAVVTAGLCGALIGSGLVAIDCEGDCGTAQGLGAVIGGVAGALGVAVVAVLVMRALAEQRLGRPRQEVNDSRRKPSA